MISCGRSFYKHGAPPELFILGTPSIESSKEARFTNSIPERFEFMGLLKPFSAECAPDGRRHSFFRPGQSPPGFGRSAWQTAPPGSKERKPPPPRPLAQPG